MVDLTCNTAAAEVDESISIGHVSQTWFADEGQGSSDVNFMDA